MIKHIISTAVCLLIFSPVFSSPVFAWIITADFENGAVGTTAQVLPPNSDAFHHTAGASKYVDSPVLAGNQAGSVSIQEGQTGFGQWGGGFNFPSDLVEGDEIWFRINAYYPEGWDFTAGATEGLKLMRIHTRSPSVTNEGYHTVLLHGGATGGLLNMNTEVKGPVFFSNNALPSSDPRGIRGLVRGLGTPIPRDQWQTYEMYIKFSSVENEGIYRAWQDGNLLFEDLVTSTLRSATSVSDIALLYTYWNSGAPRTQTSYVDNIIITSETPSNTDAFGNPMIGVPVTVPEPTSAALCFLATISLLTRRHRPRRFR